MTGLSSIGLLGTLALIAPFALLLLTLASAPLLIPKFWSSNRNKALLAAILGLPVAVYVGSRDGTIVADTVLDYAAFIALLGALFSISGGIHVRGPVSATPRINLLFLVVGAILANLIGTTGASALLVRPLISANRDRRHSAHVFIFLIFVVANCGGLLTPLGDPPLFLGFLRGVPFAWTFRLWPQWLLAVSALLVVFYGVDAYFLRKELAAAPKTNTAVGSRVVPIVSGGSAEARTKLRIEGGLNFGFLGLVILLILFCGYVIYPLPGPELLGESMGAVLSKFAQVIGMVAIANVAFLLTKADTRQRNSFTFAPMLEIAILFAGIFATMMPVLLILETKGASLGINQPWQFFWISGGLSSVLDNAPTYLTFSSLAQGVLHTASGQGLRPLAVDPDGARILAAIATGSVCMGAMTYIGNGPNFMVKAIVEESGIKMPGFFGYILWSVCVLVPLFLVMTALFFLR